MVHKMAVDDKTVKLEIWDTAGQERYVNNKTKREYFTFIFKNNFPIHPLTF